MQHASQPKRKSIDRSPFEVDDIVTRELFEVLNYKSANSCEWRFVLFGWSRLGFAEDQYDCAAGIFEPELTVGYFKRSNGTHGLIEGGFLIVNALIGAGHQRAEHLCKGKLAACNCIFAAVRIAAGVAADLIIRIKNEDDGSACRDRRFAIERG